MPITRRTMLALSGVGAMSLAVPSPAAADPVSELATLRARWRDQLTGGPTAVDHPALARARERLDTEASAVVAVLVTEPGRTRLFADLPLAGQTSTTRTANAGVSYTRLLTLATAWATPGTALHGDATTAGTLVDGLRFLATSFYRAGAAPTGNWWFWEIGIPAALTGTLTLTHEVVPSADRTEYLAAIRYFTPDPNHRGRGTSFAETGANRSDKALACALRGILDSRPDEVALARDALSDVVGRGRNSLFRYVTQGDGFYADGSYVQHGWLPYAGSYGNVALGGVAQMLALLGQSTWEVTDPNRAVVLDSVERSFAPFIRSGRMMETVRGRAVSRQRERDASSGLTTAGHVLLLATTAPTAYRDGYRALAKGWIERCSADYLGQASVPQLVRALGVMGDPAVTATPEAVGHRHFPGQERSVHHRPGWAFTVSTSSSRIGRYEWGNRENNEGWYQGDGATYVHLDADQAHYSDDFWPTHDPYHLPGVTCGDEPRANGATDGTGIPRAFRPFAGGLEVDDRYGIITMDHLGHDRTLSARKSWFCVDDTVVALGSGITSSTARRVHTTIEHRNLGDEPLRTISLDGSPVAGAMGDTVNAGTGQWAHVQGVGGYLFLDAASVQVRREERRGTWGRINSGGDTGGDDVERSRVYATVAVDHGHQPTSATYAYALLPAATPEQTASRSADPGFRVVTNDETCQSIAVADGRVLMAVLFAAGSTDVIEADGSCCIVVRREADRAHVSVSCPGRETGVLTVRLAHVPSRRTLAADPGISLERGGASTTISLDRTGLAGHSRSITVSLV